MNLLRLIYFILGVVILYSWGFNLDNRLKGVVFFWFIPLLGLGLLAGALGSHSKKE